MCRICPHFNTCLGSGKHPIAKLLFLNFTYSFCFFNNMIHRYQADMLPNVTRATVDESKLSQPKPKLVDDSVVTLPTCDDSYLPDEQWERDILEAFSELRVFIHRQSQLEVSKERKVPVPPMKDEDAWRVFCFGKNFRFEDNVATPADEDEEAVKRRKIELSQLFGLAMSSGDDAHEEVDEDEDEDDNSDGEGGEIAVVLEDEKTSKQSAIVEYKEWEGPENVTPTIPLLLQFDQVMTQRLLAHHVNWMVHNGTRAFAHAKQGAWLYALMARLEKPLYRDMASLLRSCFRFCHKCRCELSSDDPDLQSRLAQLNTLIAITGSYFGQGEVYDSRQHIDLHDVAPAENSANDLLNDNGYDDEEEEEMGVDEDDEVGEVYDEYVEEQVTTNYVPVRANVATSDDCSIEEGEVI